MSTSPRAEIVVIGPCSIANCRRPAAVHLVLEVGPRVLAGAVCEHCERASRLAAFLLELPAA
jgi:hypothetical protein